MKILIVGLNPSRRHGESQTLKRLYSWLDTLNIKFVSFVNLYDDYVPDYKKDKIQYIKTISKDYQKVIALGGSVSDCLHLVDVDHFKLPHPSGLNRQINNKKYIHDQLKACKDYLRGRS